MSIEQNKAVVRRNFEEAWNKGNLAVVDELFTTDYIGHFAAHPQPVSGLEAYKQFMAGYMVAFPDAHFTIEDMIAEGDRVVARWTVRGTHQGELAGIPPTGKQISVTGTWILCVAGGKIAEQWGIFDAMGLMQQLGVIPPPEQRTSATGRQGFITPPGEGKTFQVMGATWAFKALDEQTDGTLEAIEVVFPPGVQLPSHLHRRFDETICVLEGSLTLQVGDRTVTAPAGSFAFIPRGTVHRVENEGTSTARILLSEAPAPNIDRMMEELNQLSPDPPDLDKLVPILLRYDIELVSA